MDFSWRLVQNSALLPVNMQTLLRFFADYEDRP